jgi:hypothetical protein
MILFGVIRKSAAHVKTQQPLELKVTQPTPEGLHPYEKSFLNAFEEKDLEARKKQLQKAMIELIKSVATKMKGFSLKETVAYYERIVDEAWSTVESAGTPEVRGARYEDLMDWTMLDKDADDRTRRAFGDVPVAQPSWWHRYEPISTSSGSGRNPGHASAGPGGGGVSLPTLPGASFAASIVNGVQGFSSDVIGGLGDFTSGVTSKTNPAATSSGGGSSGGGSSCACACAGCACACAGGGR